MKKIIIAGGTGFLGRCISNFYHKKTDYEIVILSRSHHVDHDNIRYVKWDGKELDYWTDELEHAEALINLNGKSVDCRYNTANREAIYDTRLQATHVLGRAINRCINPPKVWINAASATIYRHALDKAMDEIEGETGTGFSVDVCQKWERMFNKFDLALTRKVIIRTGIVLGYDDGPMKPLKMLTRLGLGGHHGNGKQYFSWLHQSDFVRIIDFAISNNKVEGVYNVTAPCPVSNSEVMRTLRKALKVPFGIPHPTWMLRIGAFLISTETELLLKSRRVVPKRLLDIGFDFQFPDIEEAIKDLVRSKAKKPDISVLQEIHDFM